MHGFYYPIMRPFSGIKEMLVFYRGKTLASDSIKYSLKLYLKSKGFNVGLDPL